MMHDLMPVRIQRKRTKGWGMPEGAVYVGRPNRWGNGVWTPSDPAIAVRIFRGAVNAWRRAAPPIYR